jgi:hypothetical protein
MRAGGEDEVGVRDAARAGLVELHVAVEGEGGLGEGGDLGTEDSTIARSSLRKGAVVGNEGLVLIAADNAEARKAKRPVNMQWTGCGSGRADVKRCSKWLCGSMRTMR